MVMRRPSKKIVVLIWNDPHLRTDFWNMMAEEHLNALLLVCNHRDIFLDYDKITSNYASKYLRRMLLINPVNEK